METSGAFFGTRPKNFKIYQQVQTTREEGEASACFWKFKGWTLFVGENLQIPEIYG